MSLPVKRVVRNAFRLYAAKHNSVFDLGLIYDNMVSLFMYYFDMQLASLLFIWVFP